MKIKAGLIGFGRTGQVVANEIIRDPDVELGWVLRKSNKNVGEYASVLLGYSNQEGKIFSADGINYQNFYQENYVDVIIDFSSYESVGEYENAAKIGTRIVSAISNYDKPGLAKLKELSKFTPVLYSPNITLGINFLIEASKVLQRIAPHADIEIVEEHFRDKKDPSGTALRIADDLGLDRKTHVNSIRVGGIIGKHEVIFGLPNQTIRLVHESLNRAAFGQGAIYAAKWLMKKDKGLYTMEEAVALEFAKNTQIFEA